jgi:hypothetical protein
MKKIVLILLFCTAGTSLKAQVNLLYNGSFEQHSNCPDTDDEIRYAKYWDAIDTNYILFGTGFYALVDQYPEYVNTCGTGAGAVPNNGRFRHYPRTGNGMVQSVMYYDYGFAGLNEFNYFQGRLTNHLVMGQSYCVTFFVCKEQSSRYSINKIGAYLDDGTIDTTHTPAIPQSQYTPQILDTNVIYDTTNWTKIQGSFIASGSEKFITIGVFFDTGNVTHIYNPTLGSYYGIYLTDDVSVIASNAVAFAGHDTAIKPGDTVSIGASVNGDGMPCWWYVMGNTVPIDSGGTIRVHPASNTTYVVKMDLCGNITYDTVTVKVWPALVGNLQSTVNSVLLYPNPATNEVTIEHAANCEVIIYNTIGQTVLNAFIKEEKETFGMTTLPKGIYYVQVVDRNTGEKVTRKLLKE